MVDFLSHVCGNLQVGVIYECDTARRSTVKTSDVKATAAARTYIAETGVLASLGTLDLTALGTTLVAAMSTIHSRTTTLDEIIAFAMDSTIEDPHGPVGLAWRNLHSRVRTAKKPAKIASGVPCHRGKRFLVPNFFSITSYEISLMAGQISALGLKVQPRSIAAFIAKAPGPDKILSTTFSHPRIVWHKRTATSLTRGQTLTDADIDTDNTYYNKIIFELAVLCGVVVKTPFSEKLYDWLFQVIVTACAERRDVRPNHPGTMVQVGWNTGPRHAPMTLTWSLAKSLLPTEMIAEVTAAVGETGLPKMATRNIGEGTGYRMSIGDTDYDFPLYDRAPCEGLLTQNYSSCMDLLLYLSRCSIHTDPSHAPFTVSLTVRREVPPTPSSQPSSQQPMRMLRSHARNQTTLADQAPPMHPVEPAYGGSNFVDHSLKVRVVQAAGTLLAHKPEYKHCTTPLCRMLVCGMTIPFTKRIQQHFKAMKAKGTHVMYTGGEAY
ncbi:hypothetical protein K438DRAFT_1782054 [Mycena galopus ATCC 62051]|nr:hypothetical protein K438DRAFT_1782054 [Mycena galopus ATCC 62051]